jgi:hypothetical protein
MEQFKIVQTETSREVWIRENSQFNNIEADQVIVDSNVTARLFGTISKLVILKKGARLYLHGLIKGHIRNEGGEVFIFEG